MYSNPFEINKMKLNESIINNNLRQALLFLPNLSLRINFVFIHFRSFSHHVEGIAEEGRE